MHVVLLNQLPTYPLARYLIPKMRLFQRGILIPSTLADFRLAATYFKRNLQVLNQGSGVSRLISLLRNLPNF